MKNEWILDVLDDLRSFAQDHRLPALSEQLDDARLIAASELAAQRERTAGHDHGRAFALEVPAGSSGERP